MSDLHKARKKCITLKNIFVGRNFPGAHNKYLRQYKLTDRPVWGVNYRCRSDNMLCQAHAFFIGKWAKTLAVEV